MTVEGRVPPHDLDAEAAVLSAVLLNRDALALVVDRLGPDHFYSSANGYIYAACEKLAAADKPIDIVTVAGYLRDRDQLKAVGGSPYLAQLSDATPAVAHVENHADIIREKWRVRRIIAECQRVAAEGYESVGVAREWIEKAESDILAAANDNVEVRTIPSLAEAMIARSRAILSANGKRKDGLTTGIEDLDKLLGPMLPGQMILIGAHSGVGKTSLAMQVAIHVPSKCVIGDVSPCVLVVSQEMTADELADRALCGAMGMDTRTLSSGALEPHHFDALTAATVRIEQEPSGLHGIFIDDSPAMKPEQLRRRARIVAREAKKLGGKLGLIVVDYVQLMDGSDGGKKTAEKFEREVAYVSKELKKIAKQLGCVVIALAQLNEDARTEKRLPRGEDLSQCKALRHDADKVVLIHNESALERRSQDRSEEADNAELPNEVVQLIVDKNRGGREGLVHCLFQPSRSSFADMSYEDRAHYIAKRRAQQAEEQARRAAGRGGNKR